MTRSSRKKEKRRAKKSAERQRFKSEVSIELLGYPGIPGELYAVGMPAPDARTEEERLGDVSERPFEMTSVLNKAGTIPRDISIEFNSESGSAYIKFPDGAVKCEIQSSHGSLQLEKNKYGEISLIRANVLARSKGEAFSKFHKTVASFLDHISYQASVPVFVEKILGFDRKNGIQFCTYTTPYPSFVVNPKATFVHEELFPIYALYREAKNSNSNYYKFLCLYKILEGVYRHVRPNVRKVASANGIDLPGGRETVPHNDELIKMNEKDLVGKPIGELFKGILTDEFRDAIAHFKLDEDNPLLVSDYVTSAKVSNHLLLIELCCRELIASEESSIGLLKQGMAKKQQGAGA